MIRAAGKSARAFALRFAAALALVSSAVPAHALDEYLQAATLSLSRDRVQLTLRLVPGVAVAAQVLADIDANGDGLLGDSEQRAYVQRVLGDLKLSVDGKPLAPRLVRFDFPEVDLMKQGLGEIFIELEARLPAGGRQRTLALENRHFEKISAYLVNALVPEDQSIQLGAQTRSVDQARYLLEFEQAP